MKRVILSNSAFVTLVASCVEVWKREVVGFVVGRRKYRTFYAQYALPVQTAERKFRHADIFEGTEERLSKSLKSTSNYGVIGDFHSHTYGEKKLSEADINDMRKNKRKLAILLAITKQKRKKKWAHNKDKSISGSINREFSVKIFAYWLDKKRNRAIKLRIKCPYLKTVNKIMRKKKRLK